MLNQPGKSSTQPLYLDALQQLTHNYPLAFWGGLWALMVTIAGLSVVGLISAGPMEPEEQTAPSPTLTVVPPTQTALPSFIRVDQSPEQPPEVKEVPLWLFGGLGLGCAMGSLLIVRQMNRPKPRRLTKPVKKGFKPVPATAVRQQRPHSTSALMRRPVTSAAIQLSQVKAERTQPVVTVVPTSENHPLDWGEDSLADLMDLRKQQSLTSLLRQW